MPPRFKHWLFRNHAVVTLSLIALVLLLYATVEKLATIEFVFGGIGGAVAISYFVFQQVLEERKFLRELFADFNKRYDRLNAALFDIALNEGPLTGEEKKRLIEYFNLCAEEWFYFRDGIIPVPIWKSWLNGMKQYYHIDRIRAFWDQELRSDSYYGFRFDHF